MLERKFFRLFVINVFAVVLVFGLWGIDFLSEELVIFFAVIALVCIFIIKFSRGVLLSFYDQVNRDVFFIVHAFKLKADLCYKHINYSTYFSGVNIWQIFVCVRDGLFV